MNENDKSRSGLQTAVDFAHAARAAKRIMQAAAVSGVHGAAAATAREAFPLLLKILIAALVVFIVVPMVIFTALPNIFFGYNSSGTDTVIQMTQQAMTLGGVYMTLGNFEGAQIDSVVTGIAAEYEKNGTTIDHIVVSSAMTDDDLLWVIAINSAAHQQDLNTMSADLIRDFCKSSLSYTPSLSFMDSGDDGVVTTLRIEVKHLDPEKLMDELGFDDEARQWAGALYETLEESDAINKYRSYYEAYQPGYGGDGSYSGDVEYGSGYDNKIDISGFVDPSTKNNLDLASYAIQAWANNWGYPNAGTPKVFICAMHPTNPECADLLTKKDSDLRKIIETRDIPCEDKTRNAAMRTAIWSYYGDDLQVNSVELDVTKGDAKPIWEKLQKYLPVYSLFQADRKNSDSDSEVQDPLHAAVKEILQDEGISQTLDHVAEIVEGKLQEVATRTLEKLREMSPDIANTLSPVIPPASSLKWADVFKAVTISGDESIPINKRGSGSKRLILLNFFRAEVERRKDEANAPGIIYAIEEPETSQHSENQKKLINALITLSAESNVQVIITTHSAVLVNALDFKNIRLICADGSRKRVEAVHSGQLPFPSLNEVNYLAFSEISEGYHDELYGYLEEQGWLNEYKQGKTTVSYKKINTNGTTREQQICMTEYIRHQIHHPENTYNARFNDLQLRRSIEDMRAFVTSKAQTSGTT